MSSPPRCYALIVAAGRGARFGGTLPKQYVFLNGQTILRRAAVALLSHPGIGGVRVVIRPEDRPVYDKTMQGLDLLDPVAGAEERQGSVLHGLQSLESLSPDGVLIHDGARPFLSFELIDRLINALADSPGAIPVLPLIDTVKRCDPAGTSVEATLDRTRLRRAQTPQAFHYPAILKAHRAAAKGPALTDDAAVAEEAGLRVAVVDGEEDNMKVTASSDIERAKAILACPDTGMGFETRTGFGFDVHRFTDGDHVILFGVHVPHSAKLAGHSDADVGLHAITDAVLGAVGGGDIGHHFPPSDPQWKGVDSATFLTHAADLIREGGGVIVNVDATVICERPKIGPHRDTMAARVAEIVGLDANRVNIKATTTERLGFTGREEGIAAQAVVSVRMPLR